MLYIKTNLLDSPKSKKTSSWIQPKTFWIGNLFCKLVSCLLAVVLNFLACGEVAVRICFNLWCHCFAVELLFRLSLFFLFFKRYQRQKHQKKTNVESIVANWKSSVARIQSHTWETHCPLYGHQHNRREVGSRNAFDVSTTSASNKKKLYSLELYLRLNF